MIATCLHPVPQPPNSPKTTSRVWCPVFVGPFLFPILLLWHSWLRHPITPSPYKSVRDEYVPDFPTLAACMFSQTYRAVQRASHYCILAITSTRTQLSRSSVEVHWAPLEPTRVHSAPLGGEWSPVGPSDVQWAPVGSSGAT